MSLGAALKVGIACRCPACGKGRLLQGLLTVRASCTECGTDFANHEQGDGPAFFAITLVSILVGIAVVLVEVLATPPYWVHILLWPPVILIGSLLFLRWAKGIIIALQYKYRKDSFLYDEHAQD